MLTLTHLIDAVQTHKERHRQNALRLLVVLALQFASDNEVKALIGTAEFDIALKRDRVVPLH